MLKDKNRFRNYFKELNNIKLCSRVLKKGKYNWRACLIEILFSLGKYLIITIVIMLIISLALNEN